MDNKIKILDEKMKEIDERLFVDNCLFEKDEYIALKFIDDDGEEWYIGKYFFDGNTFEKISKGYAPSLYNKLEKYFDNFKELCKKLFKGDDEMGEQKIIEVTNLDELQKLLSDSKELVCKLQSKIDKINNWQPKYKEKEENKIDILNNYMKELDSHFFITEHNGLIDLCYVDGGFGYLVICTYIITDNNFVIYNQLSNLENYNMIMYYYKYFVDKVKELYIHEEQ